MMNPTYVTWYMILIYFPLRIEKIAKICGNTLRVIVFSLLTQIYGRQSFPPTGVMAGRWLTYTVNVRASSPVKHFKLFKTETFEGKDFAFSNILQSQCPLHLPNLMVRRIFFFFYVGHTFSSPWLTATWTIVNKEVIFMVCLSVCLRYTVFRSRTFPPQLYGVPTKHYGATHAIAFTCGSSLLALTEDLGRSLLVLTEDWGRSVSSHSGLRHPGCSISCHWGLRHVGLLPYLYENWDALIKCNECISTGINSAVQPHGGVTWKY